MTQADANARRYCGRDFSIQEIEAIRLIITNGADLSRQQISRLICQELDRLKPDGGLKEMRCRVALLRRLRAGIIALPLTRYFGRGSKLATRNDPQPPIYNLVHDFQSLSVTQVSSKDQSQFWNEFIHRYH